MFLLNKSQTRLIEAEVAAAKLIISHLSDELVDHICCEVEHIMQSERKSFEEAFTQIKKQTGISVLQKIQENTLYLTDKNYALMKTTMKITGNVSLALLSLGTVMKIFHLPGASLLLAIGYALLCFLFFPSMVYINHKESGSTKQPVLYLSVLLGGIAFIAGIFFKVMHWPGAGMMLLTGWSLILFLFLPLLLFVKLKEVISVKEKRIYVLGAIAILIFELSAMFKMFHWPGAGVLILTGSFLLVGLFLPFYSYHKFKESGKITPQFIFLVILSMNAVVLTSLLALNVSADILSYFVKEESNDSNIIRYYERKKKIVPFISATLKDSIHIKSSEQLKNLSENADKLHQLIVSVKLNLIRAVDDTDENTAMEAVKNPILINGKDNIDKVNEQLIGQAGNGFAKHLQEELEEFSNQAIQLSSSNYPLSKSIQHLLDTKSKTGENNEIISWEDQNFRDHRLINVIAILTSLEKNIRIVESEVYHHALQNND